MKLSGYGVSSREESIYIVLENELEVDEWKGSIISIKVEIKRSGSTVGQRWRKNDRFLIKAMAQWRGFGMFLLEAEENYTRKTKSNQNSCATSV